MDKAEKRKYQIKSMLRTIKALREEDLISYQKIFSLFDRKGKGFISTSEVLATIKKVFQLQVIGKEDEDYVISLFKFLDLGEKGCINLEEFITYVESGKIPLNGSSLRRTLRALIPKNHPEYEKYMPKKPNDNNNNKNNEGKSTGKGGLDTKNYRHSRRVSVVYNQTVQSTKANKKPKLPTKFDGNADNNLDLLKKFQKKSSPNESGDNSKKSTPISIKKNETENLNVGGLPFGPNSQTIAFSPSQFNNNLNNNNNNNNNNQKEINNNNNNNNQTDDGNDDNFDGANPIVIKELREIFNFLDIHNHGVISAHDFCVIMSRFGLIRRPTSNKNMKKHIVEAIQQEEKAMEKLFQSVGCDKDGRITFKKFIQLFLKVSGL